MNTPSFKEVLFELPSINLAAKSWFEDQGEIVIALHGWLDNANSFDELIPYFPNYNWLAVDIAGHGRSSHRSGLYYIWEYALDIAKLVEHLNKPVRIVGHSLGAAIATLTAPLIKDKCLSLTLLEGATPIPSTSQEFATQLISAWKETSKTGKLYSNFSQLVNQRQLSPISPLDENRARLLMERASEQTTDGYALLSDPKLRLPSAVKMNREQIFSMVREIECPVYILRANQGLFKKIPEDLIAQFKNLTHDSIDGDHHFHMGKSAKAVAKKVSTIL